MEELTNFEKFLRLAKSEHERQNKEAGDLEKRLSTIEENLGKLKDIVEKITRLSFVAQTIQKIEGPKKEREFPRTFQEVLNILKTDAKDDHVDFLYILWIGITNNQDVVCQRATLQELATLKCMMIAKVINMVDNSNDSDGCYWYFYYDKNSFTSRNVFSDGPFRFIPSTLMFKSKIGADHALKYFKEEWKRILI